MIRKLLVDEVPDIKRLMDPFVNEGLILPKSLLSLYTSVRDFWVMSDDKDPANIIGCCALQVSWVDIAEIRTLAVKKEKHRNGIGKDLVQACMDEAVQLGLKQLFTLTYVPGFFKRLGFSQVDKSMLPNKIWADCIHCPHFPDCKETALTYQL